MYKEFWSLYLKGYGHLRLSLAVLVITIVASALEGLNVGLLVPLLETLGSSDASETHWVSQAIGRAFSVLGLPFQLETILAALGIIVLVVAVLKYIRLALAAKLRVGFMHWLRSNTMNSLLHADVSYFHRERLGDIVDTLTSQAERGGRTLLALNELFSISWLVVAYLIAALLVSPALTGVAFGMVLLITLAIQSRVTRASRIGSALVQRNHDLQTTTMESLIGIRTIKFFRLERLRWLHFDDAAFALSDAHYHQDQNRNQAVVFQEATLFALVGVLVYLGVSVLGLGVAVIVAVLFILYRMAPRITALNMQRQTIAANMPAVYSIKKILDETSNPTIVSGDQPFSGLRESIEIQKVDFSYDGETPVLKNASFTINQGHMTAIVGASGAGKSTLVDLILRFHDPVRGRILVDGVDLRELDLDSWRRSISVVNQDIFLFNDSIYNNIAVGVPEATRKDVLEAAQNAYADGFIQRLPSGYDTIVGDRGWNLSGGQRQRIALARAILRQPKILILDEATSSLDSESERLIQQYISEMRGRTTLLVVAHRVSTIQDADSIVVLEGGTIEEEGDWDSLLQGAGVFANYQRLQSGNQVPDQTN